MQRTKEFTLDGKAWTAKEFTLADYPATDAAFKEFGGTATERVKGMNTLIQLSTGMPDEDIQALTMADAMSIMDSIMEVNGLRPKAKAAPAPEPDLNETAPTT